MDPMGFMWIMQCVLLQRHWATDFVDFYWVSFWPLCSLEIVGDFSGAGDHFMVNFMGTKLITLWWTYKKLWKMAIYSGFSHEQLWFSIAMLVHQRVNSGFQQLHTVQFRLYKCEKKWMVIHAFPEGFRTRHISKSISLSIYLSNLPI